MVLYSGFAGSQVASANFSVTFVYEARARTCATGCAPGNWPAVAGLVGFAWLELVYELNLRDHPATIAALSLGYFLAMLTGMMLFGVEQWDSQADGFRVYLNMVARLAPFCRGEDGALCLRRPLSGITQLPIRPGTVVVICTLIGTTTFDGLSNGAVWRKSEPSLQSVFANLGFGPTPAAGPTRWGWFYASC